MLNEMPFDVLECVFAHLTTADAIQLAKTSKTLHTSMHTLFSDQAQRHPTPLHVIASAITRVNTYDPEFDTFLAVVRHEAAAKKQSLIQSYPASPNFFSRETGMESMESYEPSVLISIPTTQFIRMRIDSIICNIAVSPICKGVQVMVDTLRMFHYTADIIQLYPLQADGFHNLGGVFQEFPVKATTIYILLEFPTHLTREECMNHVRLDMMHPPYPFISLYHQLDIPLDIIRPAYARPGAIFDTDFGHIWGVLFVHTNTHPVQIGPCLPHMYLVEGVEITPASLPAYTDTETETQTQTVKTQTRVLRFQEAKTPPMQINVFPRTCKTRIYFLTSNILTLAMNWQLQCS